MGLNANVSSLVHQAKRLKPDGLNDSPPTGELLQTLLTSLEQCLKVLAGSAIEWVEPDDLMKARVVKAPNFEVLGITADTPFLVRSGLDRDEKANPRAKLEGHQVAALDRNVLDAARVLLRRLRYLQGFEGEEATGLEALTGGLSGRPRIVKERRAFDIDDPESEQEAIRYRLTTLFEVTSYGTYMPFGFPDTNLSRSQAV